MIDGPALKCLEEHGETSVIPVSIDNKHNSIQHHSNRNESKPATFDGAFICRLCQAKCVDEENIKRHFHSEHSGRLPFQCSNCYNEYDSELNESKHICCKINSEKFQCVVCSKKLPNYNQLYFHISTEHTLKDSICKVCNKTFPNGEVLREHTLSHREGRRFKCTFCPKTYSNGQYLNSHMKSHTSSTVMKCKICFRVFFDKNSLFQHMLFHASMPGGDKPFTCCLCSVSFSQRGGLKFHIEQFHIGKDNMLKHCPVCEEVEDNNSLSNHIIQHCSRISANKMTKVETDWVKKKKPVVEKNCSQELLPRKAKSKLKVELEIKPDRYKHEPNSMLSKTNIQTNTVTRKPAMTKTKKESKCLVVKSNPLANTRSSTLSNTIKTHVKKENIDESSFNFKEDLELIKKRLEESSDSEFENGSEFLGFTAEPVHSYSSANEDILGVKKIKREITSSPSIEKNEAFSNGSLIPAQEKNDLFKSKKIEKTFTKERPMSFLLVTSNDKTTPIYTSDNTNKNGKNRDLLEITAKKRAIYRNKVKEDRTNIMLSKTAVNERKLRTSRRRTKCNFKLTVENELGKENLEKLEENIHDQTESEEEIIHDQTECEEENIDDQTEREEKNTHDQTQFEEETVGGQSECEEEIRDDQTEREEKNIHDQAQSEEETVDDQSECEEEIICDQTECEEENIDGQTQCEEKTVDDESECEEENIYVQTKPEDVSKSPITGDSKASLENEIKEVDQDFVNDCIKEKKYFEPSRKLSKYSCTTCMLPFSSQEELFSHSTEHIF